MVDFLIELDELDDKIAEMAEFDRQVEQALQHLDQNMTSLHAVWTGAAAQAQRGAHDRWVEGAEEMRRGLLEIRQAARRAHENYTSAGETNAQMWSQVR